MKRIGLILGMVTAVATADWKPLWPGDAPGADRPAPGAEKIGDGWRYTDIEQPQYFLYPAPEGKRTGQGVVILPGGGYTILAMNHEGHVGRTVPGGLLGRERLSQNGRWATGKGS